MFSCFTWVYSHFLLSKMAESEFKNLFDKILESVKGKLVCSGVITLIRFDFVGECKTDLNIKMISRDYAKIKNKQNNDLGYKFNDTKEDDINRVNEYYTPIIKKVSAKFVNKYRQYCETKELDCRDIDVKKISVEWSRTIVNEMNTVLEMSEEYPHLQEISSSNGFINFKSNNAKNIINSESKRDNDGYSINVHSIGIFHSCFKSKFGCPRQSLLIDESRGYFKLHNYLNVDVLDGITEYSYVWIIFIFNDNNGNTHSFKSKINPPRIHNNKIGVYGCRTPHRINPIGFSLCKINHKLSDIKKGIIYFNGIDIIDNTPIVDIKPIIPHELPYYVLMKGYSNGKINDIIKDNKILFPKWILNDHFVLKVKWNNHAITELKDIMSKYPFEMYGRNEVNIVMYCISKVLSTDIRTSHSKKKHANMIIKKLNGNNNNGYGCFNIYGFKFDIIDVVFTVDIKDNNVHVVKVELRNQHSLEVNSQNWLNYITKALTIPNTN